MPFITALLASYYKSCFSTCKVFLFSAAFALIAACSAASFAFYVGLFALFLA
jgi:hypothetical protein